MGADCCGTERRQAQMMKEAEEQKQLENLLLIQSKDFVTRGTIKEMDDLYDFYKSVDQSHENITTSLIKNKRGIKHFCKTIKYHD